MFKPFIPPLVRISHLSVPLMDGPQGDTECQVYLTPFFQRDGLLKLDCLNEGASPCRVVADGVDDEDVGGEREDHERRGEHHEEHLAH